MKEVVNYAQAGGLVIGFCNGMQILTEAGLLPGELLTNNSQQFKCQHQYIRIENSQTPFSNLYKTGEVVDFPIAHKAGNYFIDSDGLKKLLDNDQIVFKYCDATGNISTEANPNGSVENIAGITNQKGNVLGMMPHPERASEDILPTSDGINVFKSINQWIYENL
jgi:phosphoribosylformylglycinamidine synthase